MSKIKITLEDRENGHVHVECDPDFPAMLKIAQSGKITAAEGYALTALSKIMKDSMAAAGLTGVAQSKLTH